MGMFLIVMGIIFLVLVYRNMKAGLDKDWLVWTLTLWKQARLMKTLLLLTKNKEDNLYGNNN